jgi:hypothetical protein
MEGEVGGFLSARTKTSNPPESTENPPHFFIYHPYLRLTAPFASYPADIHTVLFNLPVQEATRMMLCCI